MPVKKKPLPSLETRLSKPVIGGREKPRQQDGVCLTRRAQFEIKRSILKKLMERLRQEDGL